MPLREAMIPVSDTIAALATPAGTAAIAVVRASGPAVPQIVRELFGELPAPRVARHADYRDRRGDLVDDVLFTYFAGPNSYTGEDTLEISSHGNPFIAQKLLEDLLARGCRAAEAGEFTKRAFLNGRLDLSQAEAVMDLIHARSERALAAANRQLRGALGRRMDELVQSLVRIVATVEAYIDFPDEDLPPENRAALLAQLAELRGATARLIATDRYGRVLREGIRTVIIGEPNAGKSSLLNRLAGHERALVSHEPGTTRDYLEELIAIGPHAMRLVDTAGLNPTPGEIERRGIEKTMQQAAEADLFLWVIDASAPLPSLPVRLSGLLNPHNTIAVLNKIDLPVRPQPALPYPVVQISALTGSGLEALTRALVERAEAFQTDIGEDWVAINARHADALQRAAEALRLAHERLEGGGDNVLLANELRDALAAFGEISGKVDNERILDALFATFCIGK